MNVPFNLVTAVTYRCNIRCRHCFAGSPQYDPTELKNHELSTDQWTAILKQAGEIGVHEIYFGGGEPLFREDFLQLVSAARKSGLGVTLTTNGTLCKEETAARLADLGVECVEVSMDGMASTHDRMRGGGGIFHKASRAIEYLSRHGIYVIASMTVTATNVSEMSSVYRHVGQCGAREILYMRFVPTGSGKRHRDELYISGSEFREAVSNAVPALAGAPRQDIRRQSESDAFFYPHAGCIPGRTYCFIRPNGDVTPCNPLIFPETKCGNLKERSLSELWKEADGLHFVRNLDFAHLPACDDCSKKDICSGGCRILCSIYQNYCDDNCSECAFKLSCNEATGLCGKKYMYYARIM